MAAASLWMFGRYSAFYARSALLKRNKRAMTENVVRFADYEKRSKQPDAAQPRDPADADVIVLPVIRIERPRQPEPREIYR
jgi:hypothetical protein